MRRTKIVATIGPASWDEPTIEKLIRAGMDCARLNFSHGDHATHQRTLERIRRISDELNRQVAVIQDLCGPKVRTGTVEDTTVTLTPGDDVILVAGDDKAVEGRVGVSHRQVADEVKPGDHVYLKDGLLELEVKEISGAEILCRVLTGGDLGSRKGVNIPGSPLSGIPAVTEKDWRDLEWGIEHEVDYVALSFVRSPHEIRQVQSRLRESGMQTPVIAKIEKPQALEKIDEIVRASDGIMVARGDLGVELPPERVPLEQKSLIALCMEHERPVITATQMLESMISKARPTRAEVNDVANAIFDGTDAVMLSGETATGSHPVDALSMMARIAESADDFIASRPTYRRRDSFATPDNVGEAIGRAAELIARDLDLAVICVGDVDGTRIQAAAASRPDAEIIGLCSDPVVLRRMSLLWGVTPILTPPVERGSDLLAQSVEITRRLGLAEDGEWIVLMAGSPHEKPGPVNTLRLLHLGEPLPSLDT
jgi:pyruvate kinase